MSKSISKNNTINYIILFFIVLVLLYLYQRYQTKIDRENKNEDFNLIQKYLLSDIKDNRLGSSKPIIWLFINYEYNSRKWNSFGSRSSFDLNQPYLYLTVKSIINKCDDSFNICLIDENSFSKLLPNWNIDLSHISNPVKKYMIDLAMTKILYRYGGMKVPISFVCMKDLISLYYDGVEKNRPFMCELVDRNITSTNRDFYPSIEFMGAKKEDETIRELINYMERKISIDYTDENKFLGEFDRWCNTRITNNKIKLIDGKLIGTKTKNNQPIIIDNLLSEEYIIFNKKIYGIYIPERELMKRNNFNWFIRMSPKQILESRLIISKYILLSNVPEGRVVEPLKQRNEGWVGFWKVPSAAPLWGMKPIYLGNDVPEERYPENIPGP